jgi:hypothetical protein
VHAPPLSGLCCPATGWPASGRTRTVTFVQPKKRAYRIETFDETQRSGALFEHWPSLMIPGPFNVEVKETGQTRQMLGQTAEEYRIVAIAVLYGRHVVAGTSIYWMVPNVPSKALAAFQARWSQECGALPFPGGPVVLGGAFDAMATAAAKLAGYPALYVVESRPDPISSKRMRPRVYNAAESALPQQGPPPQLTDRLDLLNIHVRETTFSGFVAGAVDPSVFAVPAGYTLRRDLKYTPE